MKNAVFYQTVANVSRFLEQPSKEDLGRTPEQLHLVQSAYSWMSAQS